MSARLLNESLSLLSPLFVVLSTYQRKRWTQKGLLGGIWRWARGKEGVPFRCGGEQRSLFVWIHEGAESEQPALAGCSLSSPLSDRRFRAAPAYLGSRPVLRPFSLIGLAHRALARGAAVDEVLPPSGLVADMVVGVCLESVHYHECQHACFNQEPSSITNTALLNGKTFPHFNYSSSCFHAACLAWNMVFGVTLFADVFSGLFFFGNL